MVDVDDVGAKLMQQLAEDRCRPRIGLRENLFVRVEWFLQKGTIEAVERAPRDRKGPKPSPIGFPVENALAPLYCAFTNLIIIGRLI